MIMPSLRYFLLLCLLFVISSCHNNGVTSSFPDDDPVVGKAPVLDSTAGVWCLGESCEQRKLRIQWEHDMSENATTTTTGATSFQVCVNCVLVNNSNKDGDDDDSSSNLPPNGPGSLHNVPNRLRNTQKRKRSFILPAKSSWDRITVTIRAQQQQQQYHYDKHQNNHQHQHHHYGPWSEPRIFNLWEGVGTVVHDTDEL